MTAGEPAIPGADELEPTRQDAQRGLEHAVGEGRLTLEAFTDRVTITAISLFGDVEITVPEGVEVELSGFDIFGDRALELAPVPRVLGSPRVRVRSFTLFGDTEVRSRR